MAINIGKLHKELVNADIPITGVYITRDENGVDTVGVHYTTEDAKEAHKDQAAVIIASHLPYEHGTFRRKFYPSIGDQLDCIYKGGDEETAWRAQITAVKARWTKNYSDLAAEDKTYVDNHYENGGI